MSPLNCLFFISDLTSEEFRLRQAYRKHNAYVQSKVPKEDLLIWKVKDGWEPLCKFLNCPIPEGPIPHDNRTGDTKFIEGPVLMHFNSCITFIQSMIFSKPIKEYAWKSKFMQRAGNNLHWYLFLDLVKCGIIGYGVWKTYKTSGSWLQTKISFLTEKVFFLK